LENIEKILEKVGEFDFNDDGTTSDTAVIDAGFVKFYLKIQNFIEDEYSKIESTKLKITQSTVVLGSMMKGFLDIGMFDVSPNILSDVKNSIMNMNNIRIPDIKNDLLDPMNTFREGRLYLGEVVDLVTTTLNNLNDFLETPFTLINSALEAVEPFVDFIGDLSDTITTKIKEVVEALHLGPVMEILQYVDTQIDNVINEAIDLLLKNFDMDIITDIMEGVVNDFLNSLDLPDINFYQFIDIYDKFNEHIVIPDLTITQTQLLQNLQDKIDKTTNSLNADFDELIKFGFTSIESKLQRYIDVLAYVKDSSLLTDLYSGNDYQDYKHLTFGLCHLINYIMMIDAKNYKYIDDKMNKNELNTIFLENSVSDAISGVINLFDVFDTNFSITSKTEILDKYAYIFGNNMVYDFLKSKNENFISKMKNAITQSGAQQYLIDLRNLVNTETKSKHFVLINQPATTNVITVKDAPRRENNKSAIKDVKFTFETHPSFSFKTKSANYFHNNTKVTTYHVSDPVISDNKRYLVYNLDGHEYRNPIKNRTYSGNYVKASDDSNMFTIGYHRKFKKEYQSHDKKYMKYLFDDMTVKKYRINNVISTDGLYKMKGWYQNGDKMIQYERKIIESKGFQITSSLNGRISGYLECDDGTKLLVDEVIPALHGLYDHNPTHVTYFISYPISSERKYPIVQRRMKSASTYNIFGGWNMYDMYASDIGGTDLEYRRKFKSKQLQIDGDDSGMLYSFHDGTTYLSKFYEKNESTNDMYQMTGKYRSATGDEIQLIYKRKFIGNPFNLRLSNMDMIASINCDDGTIYSGSVVTMYSKNDDKIIVNLGTVQTSLDIEKYIRNFRNTTVMVESKEGIVASYQRNVISTEQVSVQIFGINVDKITDYYDDGSKDVYEKRTGIAWLEYNKQEDSNTPDITQELMGDIEGNFRFGL